MDDVINIANNICHFTNKKSCETIVSVLNVLNMFCKKAVIDLSYNLNIPIIYKETTKQYLIDKLYEISSDMNLNNNEYVKNIIEMIKIQKYKNKVYTSKEMDNIPLTNPAREYASLLNQRILLQELVDHDIKHYYKDTENILENLNKQEIKNKQFSKDYNKLENISIIKKDDMKLLTKAIKMIK